MQLITALTLGACLASFAAATNDSIVWVTETKYTCPCTTLSTTVLTNSTTSSTMSTTSIKTTSSQITSSKTTSSTTTVSSTTSSAAAGVTCLAEGASCLGQTVTFGCCAPLTCDSTTNTCVNLNLPISSSSAKPTTSATTTSTTTSTTSSAPATSSTSGVTCLAEGTSCLGQTATFGCCAPLTCDSTTNTCVNLNLPPVPISASTTTFASSTTSSLSSAATCFAGGASCVDQTATLGCCAPYTCDSTTLTCVPLN